MRVVSLLPSATEILFGIGAGDSVVAVTHECDHPAGATVLPRITSSAIDHEGQTCASIDRHISGAIHSGSSIYRLDEEQLRELRPDLIVTQELCEVCAVSYRQVERAARRLPGEVPVISLEPASLADICSTIGALGRATGHETGADELVASMRERIAAVESMAPADAQPRVVCIEWTDPLMAGGHWVPEMVRRAGATDALGRERLPSSYTTWDDLVAARPDTLVLMPCGFSLGRTLELAGDVTDHPAFRELPCAATGRVAAVDGSSFFNRPGPRIVDGLRILAEIFRNDPGDPLPRGAAWVPLS